MKALIIIYIAPVYFYNLYDTVKTPTKSTFYAENKIYYKILIKWLTN